MRFADAMKMKESTLKKFMRLRDFDEHMALHRADCLASHGKLSTYEFIRQKQAEIPPEKMRPAPLVTGNDLIAAGHVPGPRFKEIKRGRRCAVEGRLPSRDAALDFVCREFPPEPSPRPSGSQC